MKRNPDVLERLASLSGAPSRGYEDLLQRRAKRELARKIGAIAVVTALIVALLGIGLGTLDDRTKPPATPPHVSHAGAFTGMVIRYTGDLSHDLPGDLVAQDPSTGKAITLAAASDFRDNTIGWAVASADGRWVAFENPFCSDGPALADWERRGGLWVTNGTDKPRQLTALCVEGPEGPTPEGQWAWSPTGSRLAAVEDDHLILIDPATGDRRDLRKPTGDVTSIAWSPDGSRIAYGTVPVGTGDGSLNGVRGSVYSVDVHSGEHTLLANVIGGVPGGEEGAGIRWSPDGTRIAVLSNADTHALYVMNADGSDRRSLAEGVFVAHTLGSPDVVWSPDGTRVAYATESRKFDHLRIWTAALDGSDPTLVFDDATDADAFGRVNEGGGPVWSPDGTGLAFRYGITWLIANADGTGDVRKIDELQYRNWRGGWYFCECYG